ncbi:MAG: FAD-dependent oxidoreductase [Pseudomonadota bacterium]
MKIAIIGTGITGNAAAWLLHKDHDITIYEQDSRIGGHSNTVSGENHADVDTGFIVFNEWTYPNLIALFDHLGVETQKTDMSFGVSLENGKVEYSGDKLFGQISNIFRPRFYRMLFDIIRFCKTAPDYLNEQSKDMSLAEYLEWQNYSQAFIDHHILPMAAAIWSTGTEDVGDFPAASFIRFFVNHGLLLLKDRPQWWTVTGGSKNYVEKLTAGFKDNIRINTPVTSITRSDDGVLVNDEKYDHVIIAAHADQALEMLKDASPEEKSVLSAFPYAPNTAYLHTDERLMPQRKSVWSSWNYLTNDKDEEVCVTYWMNKLQPFIGQDKDLFVTLNPPFKPAKDKTLQVIDYAHPQFTMSALQGWEKIKTIQGVNRTWFCGAWAGYGFHEDGLSAGLAVAEEVGGIKRPWNEKDKSPAGEHCRPAAKG